MGTTSSTQYSSKHQTTLSTTNESTTSTSTKVINSIDGRLQEFRQPITAGKVLSDHQPDMFFLCSSEHMFVNCHVPHVPADEELQPGQIYFIMPVSKLYRPISLQEICLLAIKASLVLEKSSGFEMKKKGKTTSDSEGFGMMKKKGRTTSDSGRRKRNGSVRRQERVDFQVALKRL
ncbi:hypothetical protein HanRHA438_Chr16g0745791 [Helianthus annuus]|uniref:DUF4228 domain protein n=1 Tax=Helianthus annuus TaxID=4232 RepID=A0A251SB91_HELAN|nr:uncharacterized protein LOC110914237 [Helianthus annuus]KAF5758782.1 hypothetical protein HanXRQr2_Chr16g0733351 [Helianthus annuus]KAJ0437076.1 hypothetical protein HanHA300_Chr16g0597931 [Helianthus annuus]KAJ0459387.1 hypothetical protein HanHA89_Chr16g0648391 [Helianthus annuus]KAJ0639918.1 hypothetical protein HanLR1_Chr16g0609241 [Helianthus annuus]KAJ0643877.1 hypothetical protein HanOQP8_Chr16g0605491 [Helianthus annuus]